MVDHRAGARPPRRAGVVLESFRREVSEEFQAVAPLDQGLALCREAFEFDALDLAAILFPLKAALCLLVIVKLALDPAGGTVKEVDSPPKQIVEVGFEAGVAERSEKGVEDVCDCGGDHGAFRQRPWIGFVLKRAPAVELEFGEEMIGGG